MKLIYFHGFASSGASGTVQLLRKIFPSAEIIAPDIPVDPEEALPFCKTWWGPNSPTLLWAQAWAACTPNKCTDTCAFVSTQPSACRP